MYLMSIYLKVSTWVIINVYFVSRRGRAVNNIEFNGKFVRCVIDIRFFYFK